MQEPIELNVNLPSQEELDAAEKAHQQEFHSAGNWHIYQKQQEAAQAEGNAQ